MANAIDLARTEGEAFLEWEAGRPVRHFLHDERVYATSGGSPNHGSITPALTEICRWQLRETPCRYRDENTKVRVSERRYYYPDGLIACPPNTVSDSSGTIDNPKVIFEVLSPGTKDFDREEKFDAYRLFTSFEECVLIHSEIVRVEVFQRQADGNWGLSVYLPGSVPIVESVGIDLPLDELYEEALLPSNSSGN